MKTNKLNLLMIFCVCLKIIKSFGLKMIFFLTM